jgi:hypothetical protein
VTAYAGLTVNKNRYIYNFKRCCNEDFCFCLGHIRGMGFGGLGHIRGMGFGGLGCIRGMSFGGLGRIRGRTTVIVNMACSRNRNLRCSTF